MDLQLLEYSALGSSSTMMHQSVFAKVSGTVDSVALLSAVPPASRGAVLSQGQDWICFISLSPLQKRGSQSRPVAWGETV